MSENNWQFETDIVINGKSKITVARHLRCCGVAFSTKIDYKFTAEYTCKIFLNTSQHLAKLQARKLIVSRTLRAWALSY